jgi:microcystin-dependent protein
VPLETATYISDLVATNPAASDPLGQADDHIRLVKLALKSTFPNFTSAPLNSTQAQIDAIAALLVNGQLTGNGACPPGALMDFGGTTAPTGWLICDGQAVSRTTYAALFTAIGTTWGAGDGSTTFNVPGLQKYFRRHRDGGTLAGAVGVLKNPANLAHTHTGSGSTGTESNDHMHTYAGTTGTDSPDHSHGVSINAGGNALGVSGGGSFSLPTAPSAVQSGGASARHAHAFSGTTSGINVNHTHTFSVTTGGGSADDANEARPYSATVLTCIKT